MEGHTYRQHISNDVPSCNCSGFLVRFPNGFALSVAWVGTHYCNFCNIDLRHGFSYRREVSWEKAVLLLGQLREFSDTEVAIRYSPRDKGFLPDGGILYEPDPCDLPGFDWGRQREGGYTWGHVTPREVVHLMSLVSQFGPAQQRNIEFAIHVVED